MLQDKSGMPIIFDVIQYCSDFLIANQHSTSLLCPICLCSLSLLPISSTPCEHYTHTKCLEEHTFHTRKQLGEKFLSTPQHLRYQIDKSLLCPVCREVIDEDIVPINPSSETHNGDKHDNLSSWTNPQDLEEFYFDWKKWHDEQAALQPIYDRQKENGGIIDLEEEKKKNLITEDTVVVLSSTIESTHSEISPSDSTVPGSLKTESSRKSTKGYELFLMKILIRIYRMGREF